MKHAEETQNETKTDHEFSDTVHRTARGLYWWDWLDWNHAAPVLLESAGSRAGSGRRGSEDPSLAIGSYRRTLAVLSSPPATHCWAHTAAAWNYEHRPVSVGSATTLGRAVNSRTETINQSSSKTKAIHVLTTSSSMENAVLHASQLKYNNRWNCPSRASDSKAGYQTNVYM